MYLFVFLWVPSLQEAADSPDTLPLGYIFSCFMIAMMLGSLLYTSVTGWAARARSGGDVEGTTDGGDSNAMAEAPLLLNAKLSSLVCAVSALAFAVTITCKHEEHFRFWAFCAFEACVGLYYPVQGMLRGVLISNEHRATVSGVAPIGIYGNTDCGNVGVVRVRPLVAGVALPRPAQRLRCRLAPHGRILRT